MRFVSGPKDKAPINRAEEARRRLTQQSHARVNSASNRVINPIRNKAVTTRGNLFGSPIHQQAGSRKARRQFYVTMDQHGSELRLPALPVINFGWRLASSLIVILSVIGIFSLWSSTFFQVAAVEVKGLKRIQPKDITSTLMLENLSIVRVDRDAALQALEKAFPELINLEMTVELPNIVVVSAGERQPVLAWKRGDKVDWVDTDGVIFPARGEVEKLLTIESDNKIPLAPLPIEEVATNAVEQATAQAETASGDAQATPTPTPAKQQPKRKADPVLLNAARELSQKLPEGTVLIYQNAHGLGWNDPNGWQVFIGKNLNQFEEKYALYQNIAKYLVDQGIQPVLVSVEHLNAPYYRLEQ